MKGEGGDGRGGKVGEGKGGKEEEGREGEGKGNFLKITPVDLFLRGKIYRKFDIFATLSPHFCTDNVEICNGLREQT